MFPPVTQRIAQNAIIGGAGSQQHGAPRHAAGSTHAGHGHVAWPRMAQLACQQALVRWQPRWLASPLPPSDAAPPRMPPPTVAFPPRMLPPIAAKQRPLPPSPMWWLCLLPWRACCRRWWVSLETINARFPDGGATPWGSKDVPRHVGSRGGWAPSFQSWMPSNFFVGWSASDVYLPCQAVLARPCLVFCAFVGLSPRRGRDTSGGVVAKRT